MENEENIIRDIKEIDKDLNIEEKAERNLMQGEAEQVRTDKLELKSTRTALYRLLKRYKGEITVEDKLIDILKFIDDEFSKIEEI